MSEIAVHGGAGDAQHLCYVGGRDALVPELAGLGGLGVINLAWASALAPIGCGSGQPHRSRGWQLLDQMPQSAACSVSEDHVRLFRSGDATRMFVSTRITATRLIVLSGSGVVNMHAPPWDADLTACVISSG